MTEMRSGLPIIGFADAAAFERWIEAQPADTPGLWVRVSKAGSGVASVSKAEAIDVALCQGWIDGQLDKYDDAFWLTRFTPRKPRSIWSAVNIARAQELVAEGRMQPAGLAAFEARSDDRSAIYSYEQRHDAKLAPEQEREFRANPRAWEFFQGQPTSYRKTALWWVVSAKREETRARRLRTLVEDSANGRRLRHLSR